MNRYLVVLVMCIISSVLFAQNNVVSVQPNFFRYIYSTAGAQIDEEVIDSLMNEQNEIGEVYSRSMTKHSIQVTATALGGFLLGFSAFTYIVEEMNLPRGDENKLFQDAGFLAVAGTGLALISVSLPLHCSAKKDALKAVELYNNKPSSGFYSKPETQFYVSFTPNSLGLRLRF